MSGAFQPSLSQRKCRPGSFRIRATFPKRMYTRHCRSWTTVYNPNARQNAAMIGPRKKGPKKATAAAIKKSTIADLQDRAPSVAEKFQPDVAHVGRQSVGTAFSQLTQLVSKCL